MEKKNYILTSDGRLITVRDSELRHASAGKGKERENHKYLSREWKNGRWNYVYKNDAKGGKGVGFDKEYAARLREYDIKGAKGIRESGSRVAGAAAKGSTYLRRWTGPKGSLKKPEEFVDNAPKTKKPYISPEYQAELEFNSKKNTYPQNNNKNPKPQKTFETGVKKTESFLEKIGNAFTSTIKKAVDTGLDWLDNLFEGYQTDYERAKIAVNETQDNLKRAEAKLDKARAAQHDYEEHNRAWEAAKQDFERKDAEYDTAWLNARAAKDRANTNDRGQRQAEGGAIKTSKKSNTQDLNDVSSSDISKLEKDALDKFKARNEASDRESEAYRLPLTTREAHKSAMKEYETAFDQCIKANTELEKAKNHPLRKLDQHLEDFEKWVRDRMKD